ncbi:hypothetical protein JRO89_XS08G0001200 [Xanthoceras sorbifolium]|uniref:SUN domain-containing protein n=1 Tax=Xanthoceras sorbifolium TaxID=99658 RepID=A0ABQ8HMV5_9ROSI|nr:hypothetical protein JRO89_XS08G0001200 [Xanthoceras sorbifolium]
MQRSREAFLRRKALYNNFDAPANTWDNFYVPLLLLFCGLSFFNFSIAHVHAHPHTVIPSYCVVVDRSEILGDKICWREAESGFITGFLPTAECPADMCCLSADSSSDTAQADTLVSGRERLSEEDYQNYDTTVQKKVGSENLSLDEGSVKTTPKSERLIRDVPLAFDEFRNKAINPRGKSSIHQAGSIMHKVEPGGAEYNFASASRGAKVLAVNKEAKGAPNILGKDMDKYLRNPCSAEGKFVVIELSEETLVYTIEIANFEHHSSNLKDFKLLGSLVYPTESWVELGNFTAKNVKQSQRFLLQEPKWVRYLKLILLNHYGSEFYCTLSTVQVYGVDAVEHMLEDLISVQDNILASEGSTEEPRAIPPSVIRTQIDGLTQNLIKEDDSDPASDHPTPKQDASANNMGEQVGELRQQTVGRIPGDSVLKILMQKVRSLDLNLSVLERYLEELNSRYGNIVTDFEKEIAEKDALLKEMRSDLKNLGDRKEVIGKDVQDIMSWKLIVSSQMDILDRENALLRLKMERIMENQVHMENKGIVVLLVSLVCIILAISKLFVEITMSVCRKEQEFRSSCTNNFSWIVLLLSCSIIGIILLL